MFQGIVRLRVGSSSRLLAAIPSSAGIVDSSSATPKTCVDMRTFVRENVQFIHATCAM